MATVLTTYTVLASHSRNNVVERIDEYTTDSMRDAFRKLGEWAPIACGVIVIDEQGNVWAEIAPGRPERPTREQQSRYRIWQREAA